MTQTKLDSLTKQTADFCSSASPETATYDIPEDLLKQILQAAFEDSDHNAEYTALIDQIKNACQYSDIRLSLTLRNIGFDMYDKQAPAFAEAVFRRAVSISPIHTVQNNLAYVCRHHRDVLKSSDVEIIDLLVKGVQEREPFSLVNMALHFACNLARKDDWLLADRMIRLIQKSHISFQSVLNWWGKLADEGDDEGFLVLQWLARHEKHQPPEQMHAQLAAFQKRRTDLPGWIFETYVNS